MLGANNGFPEPYYDNGCLPDNFKDKCEACMRLEGGKGNKVQTKRCAINAKVDPNPGVCTVTAVANGCVEKAPKGDKLML